MCRNSFSSGVVFPRCLFQSMAWPFMDVLWDDKDPVLTSLPSPHPCNILEARGVARQLRQGSYDLETWWGFDMVRTDCRELSTPAPLAWFELLTLLPRPLQNRWGALGGWEGRAQGGFHIVKSHCVGLRAAAPLLKSKLHLDTASFRDFPSFPPPNSLDHIMLNLVDCCRASALISSRRHDSPSMPRSVMANFPLPLRT